jgi:hypothetical protein
VRRHAGLDNNQARRNIRKPGPNPAAAKLLTQNDRSPVIQPDQMQRVLACIKPPRRNPAVLSSARFAPADVTSNSSPRHSQPHRCTHNPKRLPNNVVRQPLGRYPSIWHSWRECRSMEKIVTRAIGGLLLVLISPILLFIWIGLKAERADPAITMRTTGRLSTYSFVLGSGWISSFVRRAELRALPSIWHLVNGDTVLRFEDLARIISPSSRTSA